MLYSNFLPGGMLGWFEEKYGSTQFYYLWRSIKYFADAENDPEIIGFFPIKATWEKTKEEICFKCWFWHLKHT